MSILSGILLFTIGISFFALGYFSVAEFLIMWREDRGES